MNLIIKGTVEDAKRAAESRGIPLADCVEIGKGRVRATVAEDCRTAVIYWFCEEPTMADGHGYEPGTLLLHN